MSPYCLLPLISCKLLKDDIYIWRKKFVCRSVKETLLIETTLGQPYEVSMTKYLLYSTVYSYSANQGLHMYLRNSKYSMYLEEQCHEILESIKLKQYFLSGRLWFSICLTSWLVRYLKINFLTASVQTLTNSTDITESRCMISTAAYTVQNHLT